MITDLKMLAFTAALTAVFWLPYILAHIKNVGLGLALTYRADAMPLPPWAARAKKAHDNAVENLVPFASLVIVSHLIGATNDMIVTATIVYFWARVAHFILYTAGVPFGRTLAFAVSWLAMAVIFAGIVGTV